MKQARAEALAQDLANMSNEEYCIIKARNGQWRVERFAFIRSREGRDTCGEPIKSIVFKPVRQ